MVGFTNMLVALCSHSNQHFSKLDTFRVSAMTSIYKRLGDMACEVKPRASFLIRSNKCDKGTKLCCREVSLWTKVVCSTMLGIPLFVFPQQHTIQHEYIIPAKQLSSV